MSRNQTYLVVIGAVVLGLCGLVVVGAALFFVVNKTTSVSTPAADVLSVVPDPVPSPDGNSMGDPNAPVQMEEFADFQCPYCQQFHQETQPLLVQNYVSTGKVYFTWRSMGNFVSQNIGGGSTESQDAALAAYCAADQNMFWDMQAYLFANVLGEDAGSFTHPRLKAIAEKAGLDMVSFNDCHEGGKYLERIRQDADDGRAAGVNGVPSFLVTYTVAGETKTKLIEGAQPFSSFEEQLDEILNEMGAQ